MYTKRSVNGPSAGWRYTGACSWKREREVSKGEGKTGVEETGLGVWKGLQNEKGSRRQKGHGGGEGEGWRSR